MAKKGQKFDKYNEKIKEKIIIKINEGYSLRFLAKTYDIPFGTIATWTHKKNHPEIKKGKRGRPKEKYLTKEDWKERYEILKKYQAFLKAQRERK